MDKFKIGDDIELAIVSHNPEDKIVVHGIIKEIVYDFGRGWRHIIQDKNSKARFEIPQYFWEEGEFYENYNN